jgi:hypothetical protein
MPKLLSVLKGAAKIETDTSHRFVSDAEKAAWNALPQILLTDQDTGTVYSLVIKSGELYMQEVES